MVEKSDVTDSELANISKYSELKETDDLTFIPDGVNDVKLSDLEYLLSDKKWPELIKDPKMVEVLMNQGYSRPSKIQRITVPLLTNKKDLLLVAQAKNGSGKTLAFLIPAILRVNAEQKSYTPTGLSPQVIILEQQREVANQVAKICTDLAKIFNDKIEVSTLSSETERGHIIISTPIKIEEFLREKNNLWKDIKLFIVDEADQVLEQELGQRIMSSLLKKIKNTPDVSLAFFSATYTEYTKKYFQTTITGKEKFEFGPKNNEEMNLDNIQQYYSKNKDKLQCIKDTLASLEGDYQTIIFVNFRATSLTLYEYLKAEGYEVGRIVGGQEMRPDEREKVISDFRSMKYRVLITTNLLARGFDDRLIGLVINMDIPVYHYDKTKADTETYLHRIGRTGRFGDRGVALNIVEGDKDLKLLEQIKDKYKCEIKEFTKENLKNLKKMLQQVQSQNAKIKQIIKNSAY